MKLLSLSILLACFVPAAVLAKEPIRLANNPALSPDGQMLAFDWNGDLWTVPITGGTARQLTFHPGKDRQPKFSPDGKQLAFVSEREGSPQVYVMPAMGGAPRQVTFHTAGYTLEDWFPDGQALLVSSQRDHFWRHAERFFKVSIHERKAEQLLFDDYGRFGQLSPDGNRLLFVREGPAWWRKGYRGSQAAQIWQFDLKSKEFQKLCGDDRGNIWPLWKPDGKGFYYVSGQGGSFNLWEYREGSKEARPVTTFTDDSVVFPCISRDGSTIVFRHLFDFYSLKPGNSESPRKIDIFCDTDRPAEQKQRRVLTQATAVAFSSDGLEIAFIAGGDLWVMDTELREPKQVTKTPEEERFPVFAPDGESLLVVSDQGGQCDIWKITRSDREKYWWQNEQFHQEQLTNDPEVETNLKWSPDGKRFAYVKGGGDLWARDAKGTEVRRLVKSWNAPDYDWSPDGQWIVYAVYDNDFNRDIWIQPLDNSRPPFNVSRHPNNDNDPVWSPDGKVIAFTGRRSGDEVDIYYVWLQEEDHDKGSRDRNLEKALEKMRKSRSAPKSSTASPKSEFQTGDGPGPKGDNRKPKVVIDFDRLHERVRRVTLPDSTEENLFFISDKAKLAFSGMVEGRRGTYTIDIPDDLQPKLLTAQTGTQARWLRQSNQIVWLSNGLPASLPVTAGAASAPSPTSNAPPGGGRLARSRGTPPVPAPSAPPPSESNTSSTPSGYRFQAYQEVEIPRKNAAVFDLCWRTMRDQFYDERLGNRDWSAIRIKYRDLAAQAPDLETLGAVVNLMLGELNASHLGFTTGALSRPDPDAPPPAEDAWRISTAHFGLRFDPAFEGPGLKVRDVLPDSPAAARKVRILPGEVVLAINGVPVHPTLDLTTVLNGPLNRDFFLRVQDATGKEREVTLRPISFQQARRLLYEKWLADNRKLVDELSHGTLGYLHINAMSMPSFYRFEQELYAAGAGKDGLVIDVRENGGGSTADHLLTALTQPVHAITVPRGGGPGYPQDRKVYATWSKPIVVLCNQNSFSNAEIFSHAIKTLKRGPLVGVPTAGGVISTGGTAIMDVGFLRLPFRGWFTIGDGEDMELNGAVPDHLIWPEPGQIPVGKDVQLEKAVDVLRTEVKAWRERPQPKLKKATQRK